MKRIESDVLRVDINPVGAELSSLFSKKSGTEYLWQGDAAWWTGRAPVLFPIVCAMKNGRYVYNGKTYEMPKHGFVRHANFEEALATESKVILAYRDSEATREMYPFAFLFQVIFEVTGDALHTTYRVENLGNAPMYFSMGSHEAFNCPREAGERFEDYYLEFDTEATYVTETVNAEGLIKGDTYTVIENDRVLPLKHELFENDALIFKNVPGSKVLLKSKKSSAVVEMDYQNAPQLGIWTKVGAPYICIEPWFGLPDDAGHDGVIENKFGMVKLDAGRVFSWVHTVTICEV